MKVTEMRNHNETEPPLRKVTSGGKAHLSGNYIVPTEYSGTYKELIVVKINKKRYAV